jgi:hypothetical protein
MSHQVLVQYTGFQSKPLVREYTFSVREAELEPREVTLTIPNEAFNSRRARFQDAPDICSLRLWRELAACDNHLPKTHFRITDAEMDDYREAHSPSSSRKSFLMKPPRAV